MGFLTELKIGLGAYPIVTLAMARELARDTSTLRVQGIDPQDARREQQEQAKIAEINTFELMARAWLKKANPTWFSTVAPKHPRNGIFI